LNADDEPLRIFGSMRRVVHPVDDRRDRNFEQIFILAGKFFQSPGEHIDQFAHGVCHDIVHFFKTHSQQIGRQRASAKRRQMDGYESGYFPTESDDG